MLILSETVLKAFILKVECQFGLAKVIFSQWKYLAACHFSPSVVRRRLRIFGLPSTCWHPDASNFFLKGLGLVIDTQGKRRLGNELL